jgi:23S rRNA pseudouridine1911/1915/1917 synthase
VFYNFKFNSENQRLDEFLRLKLPEAVGSSQLLSEPSAINISNSKIRRLILAGAVQVNGKVVKRPAFELRGRSTVDVNFDPQRFFYEKQPDDVVFEMTDEAVLYEDENLIFVNKPADFPVEQTITGNRANLHDAVVDYLWKRNPALRNPPYVGIMHRLDRTTSGVIVFTKKRAVNKEMSELFQKHELTKQYFAVVEEPHGGMDDRNAFSVEMFMGRTSGKSQQGKWGELPESRGGQYSKTDFRVSGHLKVEGRPCLLIECTLYTGRTHQIRVHLAGRGLPIFGDTLYGGAAASRLYLHAAHLSFTLNGIAYDVKSPFPGL